MLPPLYAISDRRAAASPLPELFAAAARGGLRLIQIREKDLPEAELAELTKAVVAAVRPYGARVLVNRTLAVAFSAGAGGLHIGADRLAEIGAIKAQAAPGFLVGVSTHDEKEARAAALLGADFVTFGPAYETPSKAGMGLPTGPERIGRLAKELEIPVYALGGIDESKIAELRAAGVGHIALIRALIAAPDPEARAALLLKALVS